MSSLLKRLGIKHKVIETPKDGNCFYWAFIAALDLDSTPEKLRKIVDSKLTENEHEILLAINSGDIESRWADEIDILALLRYYNYVDLIIIDNIHQSLIRLKPKNKEMTKTVLVSYSASELHYSSVELSRKDKEYITKIFKTQYKKIEDSNNNVVVLTATLTIILFMVPLLTKSTK